MNSEVKISVCIITYNQEKYVDECLDSITCQKGNFHLEIVIRDDFSTDSTYEKITNNLSKINNEKITIKVLEAEKNLGANRNILEVLKNCTGEYVAFCEGDDYWCDPYKLQKQLNAAIENPNVGFFVHPAYYHYSDGKIRKVIWPINKKKHFKQKEILKVEWQFAPTCSYFIRADMLSRLPEWFEDAAIGDMYIEVYAGEMGVHVIHDYMSAYRYLSYNSWSKDLLSTNSHVLNKKIKVVCDQINNLLKIKKDFNGLKESVNYKLNLNYFVLLSCYIHKKDLAQLINIRKTIMINKEVINFKQKIKLMLSYFPNLYMFLEKII